MESQVLIKVNRLFDHNNRLFQLARYSTRLPNPFIAISSLLFLFGSFFFFRANVLDPSLNAFISELIQDRNSIGLIRFIMLMVLFDIIILLVVNSVYWFCIWIWLRIIEKRPFCTLGLEKNNALPKYLRGVIIAILTLSLVVVAILITKPAEIRISIFESPRLDQQILSVLAAILVFFGWMAQGAIEEFIFRGWLLSVLGARHGWLLGVLVSSFVFAMIHFDFFLKGLDPSFIIFVFLLGVFTALYALSEGGIWGACAFHSTWNWGFIHLFRFQSQGNIIQDSLFYLGPKDGSIADSLPFIYVILSMLLNILIILIFRYRSVYRVNSEKILSSKREI